MPRIAVQCCNCDARILRWPSHLRKLYFCSRNCSDAYQIGKRAACWQGSTLTDSCLLCGALFSTTSTRRKYGRGRYCSRPCFYIGMRKSYSDKHNVSERRRYARLKQHGRHTATQWRSMLSYYTCCLACGRRNKLTKDHILPLICGGTDRIENIQVLCKPCNVLKGRKFIDYRPFVGAWC